jgi:predicted SAM-dependent methyltransferase
VNTDIVDGDVRLDLRHGLPFPDGCAKYVYTCHMLEHLAYPHEALPLLREAHRVLGTGGVIRIVVPDTEPLLRAYAADDHDFFTERSQYWTWADPTTSRLAQFLEYSGANRDPFDLIGHKYGYDFETLAQTLGEAGFGPAVRSAYQASAHPDLRIDDWSDAASYTVRGEHLSLFVEAERLPTPAKGDGDE